MCTCIYAHLKHVYIYIYIYTCFPDMHRWKEAYLGKMHTYELPLLCICMHVYMNRCVYTYVDVYVCMYVCVYIYICIYMLSS